VRPVLEKASHAFVLFFVLLDFLLVKGEAVGDVLAMVNEMAVKDSTLSCKDCEKHCRFLDLRTISMFLYLYIYIIFV